MVSCTHENIGQNWVGIWPIQAVVQYWYNSGPMHIGQLVKDWVHILIYIMHLLLSVLVVGTICQEGRPPRGQLWMEQCLTSLKYWPIWYTIWADPNYTWGLAILADSFLFSVNNISAGLWLNCISSVEITLFLLADILLQHRALFQC